MAKEESNIGLYLFIIAGLTLGYLLIYLCDRGFCIYPYSIGKQYGLFVMFCILIVMLIGDSIINAFKKK